MCTVPEGYGCPFYEEQACKHCQSCHHKHYKQMDPQSFYNHNPSS